jgi:arsenate reductase
MSTSLLPGLSAYTEALIAEADRIPPERKSRLQKLADYVHERADAVAALTFVCTHNSRRSQLARVWAAVAARHFGLDHVRTYSGGTEVTAFNPRAVAALERAGFRVEDPGGENPHYLVRFSPVVPPLACWSKTYDDPANPKTDFAAVMTCAQADADCPFIPGADARISLPYDDPKEADGTPHEVERYDERLRQIGRELFYVMGRGRRCDEMG